MQSGLSLPEKISISAALQRVMTATGASSINDVVVQFHGALCEGKLIAFGKMVTAKNQRDPENGEIINNTPEAIPAAVWDQYDDHSFKIRLHDDYVPLNLRENISKYEKGQVPPYYLHPTIVTSELDAWIDEGRTQNAILREAMPDDYKQLFEMGSTSLLRLSCLLNGHAISNSDSNPDYFARIHAHLEDGRFPGTKIPYEIRDIYGRIKQIVQEKSVYLHTWEDGDAQTGKYLKVENQDIERLCEALGATFPPTYYTVKAEVQAEEDRKNTDPVYALNCSIKNLTACKYVGNIHQNHLSRPFWRGLAKACLFVLGIDPGTSHAPGWEESLEESAYREFIKGDRARGSNGVSSDVWHTKGFYVLAYAAGRNGAFTLLNPEKGGEPQSWEIQISPFLQWCKSSGVNLRSQLLATIEKDNNAKSVELSPYNEIIDTQIYQPKRGPRANKRNEVVNKMRAEILAGTKTVKSLSHQMEKSLANEYDCSRDTARKARREVISPPQHIEI